MHTTLQGHFASISRKFNLGIISDDDAELVSIAALLHDIGHPPFSHLLETDKVFANFHSHEDWGKMMLESEETEIGIAIREVLGDERTSRLFALYSGKDEHDGEAISPFLKEIVSSQLDVDRMDYMIRDQANSGAQIGGFDSARVIRALRVGENGHLYAKQWGLPAIEAYLVTRYHLVQPSLFPQGKPTYARVLGWCSIKSKRVGKPR